MIPVALQALGCALAIGLLIGLERGWTARQASPGTRVAGWRTFGLLGLVGGLAAMMPPVVAAAVLLLVGAILLVGYYRQSGRDDGLSATNAVAALLTLLLGYEAGAGLRVEALAVAAVATLILSMRNSLHGWLRGMSEPEERSAARFALIALVLLPLLPDRSMGPLSAWNPRQLGIVVVLVSGLSFIGYLVARRSRAERGILMTALCGAIVSSTAVTAAYARRLRAGQGPANALIGGIVLASGVMFLRVLLLSSVLVSRAVPTLLVLTMPAFAISLIASWIVLRRQPASRSPGSVELGNPLDLGAAIGLALLVAAISLATRYAFARFGEMGVASVIALTGLADVDAAVLSLAALPPSSLPAHVAGIVLIGPIILNTLVKAGLAALLAHNRAGLRAAGLLVLAAATSTAMLVVMLVQR